MLMKREENRDIFLGTVYPTQKGFQWYGAPMLYKNKDDMVYKYFEGKSGDGPLVLRLTKRNDYDQFAVSVNNLHVALSDRGLQMKPYTDDIYRRHVIGIYREHIKPTTLWWDGNGMQYAHADTN